MTKINQVSVCPSCSSEVPVPKPSKCPACGYQLIAHQTDIFGTPDYAYSQYRSQIEILGSNNQKNPEAIVKGTQTLSRELRKFMSDIADQDKVDALMDAELILATSIIANMSPEKLKQVVKLGIRIGAKAKAIDDYIKAGGVTNGFSSTTKPVPSEQDDDEFGGERD